MNEILKQQKVAMKPLKYVFVLFSFWQLIIFNVHAQSQMIRVKTLNEQLQPMSNLGLSINGGDYIFTGDNGSTIIELGDRELPVKSIDIEDEKYEVKAWNYSKSTLEVVVLKKNYKVATVFVINQNNEPVANTQIIYNGEKVTREKTNADGRLEIMLASDEKIKSISQFSLTGYDVTRLQSTNNRQILHVKRLEPAMSRQQSIPVEEAPAEQTITKEAYLKNFDFSKIDSIQSLTMFYAIFKNYEVSSLPAGVKQKVDAKFDELMVNLQDSLHKKEGTYMSNISDSSLLTDDLHNLLNQARVESRTLISQREEFDEKISIIEEKLELGIANLDTAARATLYSDLLELERILRENENRFYKNMNYYREIINSIKEKYFDFQNLEDKLTESEAKLLEEQRIFRKRLLGISAIVLLFTILILLLIKFSNRLKRQKSALEEANSKVKRINENLEEIVQERTKLLEESNRELDTFLYRASHDLRSPVCTIKGLCNIASSQVNGESKEIIQRAITITDKMDKLLQKLSIISEINQPTEYNAIAFRTMIDNVVDRFSHTIEAQQVELEINCPEDIELHSNPRLVEVVLTNLLDNALYYGSLQKKSPVRVVLTAAIVRNKMEFSIQDNGIGIHESIRDRLFEMFFKGHEASKGNGLGLYIVQKSVLALKGTIDLESEHEAYTKFLVRIPLKLLPKHTTSGTSAERKIMA